MTASSGAESPWSHQCRGVSIQSLDKSIDGLMARCSLVGQFRSLANHASFGDVGSARVKKDSTLPNQPMRQWVLSVPFPLRFLFTRVLDPELSWLDDVTCAKPKCRIAVVLSVEEV